MNVSTDIFLFPNQAFKWLNVPYNTTFPSHSLHAFVHSIFSLHSFLPNQVDQFLCLFALWGKGTKAYLRATAPGTLKTENIHPKSTHCF